MIQIQILPREIPFFFPSIIPASPSSPASKSSFSISLPPLFIYAAMVDISDKTARTATVFNSHGRERKKARARKRGSARSYISSGFEVSHRSSDEDARKRAERIKGDYKLCPCYPRWKRLWIFYVGGGAISIGFSRHSRGHSIKNSVKPVLTNGAQRYQLPVWKSKTAEEDDARRGEDSEELNEISPRIPGWMKRYIYIYIYSI